jgi:hypothetical protein
VGALLNAAWVVAAELIILCLAGFIFFHRRGNTLAEAFAYGLVSTLMTLSFLLQLSLMAGLPAASLAVEIPLVVFAAAYVSKHRKVLVHGWRSTRALYSRAPLAGAAFGLLAAYLACQAYIIPPTTDYWQPLGQILLYARHAAQLSSDAMPASPSPTNTLVLPYLFLRFQTDLGVGLLGFMAYLAVGCSAYALSRRYAWQPTAATVAVIIVSMPRLVYLSTSPGYDIIPAATAMFCLLAAFRAIESPNLPDLYLLGLGILFMISGSFMSHVFPLILIPLTGILLIRRHGLHTWWAMISTRPFLLLACLLPAAVFSHVWLLLPDAAGGGTGPGALAPPPVAFNDDGIQGALANALRYTLQSIHFTQPIDSLLNWTTGFSPTETLQNLHDRLIVPILGNRGAADVVQISWLPDEKLSWFGPFGFLLVMPAVGYAAKKAPRRLKAISIALIGYFFLLALIPAWRPENVRYFDVFFVCGGICIAFFLPPWRLSRNRRHFLVFICAGMMLYAATCNIHKPALGWPLGKTGGSIWQSSGWGLNRSFAAKNIYGDDRLEKTLPLADTGERLWLIYTDFSFTYPFLLHLPNARILSATKVTPGVVDQLRDGGAEFLIFIDGAPPYWLEKGFGETIWLKTTGAQRRPGAIVHFDRSKTIRQER